MTTTTNLNIRTDRDVKERSERIFSELGMSMTTAFNIFAKTAVREQKIPFEISAKATVAPTANQVAENDVAMNLAAKLIEENRPALEVLAK